MDCDVLALKTLLLKYFCHRCFEMKGYERYVFMTAILICFSLFLFFLFFSDACKRFVWSCRVGAPTTEEKEARNLVTTMKPTTKRKNRERKVSGRANQFSTEVSTACNDESRVLKRFGRGTLSNRPNQCGVPSTRALRVPDFGLPQNTW